MRWFCRFAAMAVSGLKAATAGLRITKLGEGESFSGGAVVAAETDRLAVAYCHIDLAAGVAAQALDGVG